MRTEVAGRFMIYQYDAVAGSKYILASDPLGGSDIGVRLDEFRRGDLAFRLSLLA